MPAGLIVDGQVEPFQADVPVSVGDLEIVARARDLGSGTRLDLVVRNPSRSAVAINRVGAVIEAAPEMVLEHGYQSWSVVRRCSPNDVRPERTDAAEWGRATHVADPERAGTVISGDQFLVTSDGVVGFLDGRRHLSTVEARDGELHALALLDGVELGPGEERRLDPLWLSTGDPGARYSEFATLWGEGAGARISAPAPVGWCSWYHYFADVTPANIRSNAVLARDAQLGLAQIDDGWQAAIGDWDASSERWGEDVSVLAEEVAGLGMEAGLWTAPFLAAAASRVATEHPDWIATHRSGHPLRAMYNDSWGGWALGLDTTHPAVLDHLTSLYASLRAKGFGYHKIDFCYAAAVPAVRHDRTKTRGQALRAGLEAVRAGIGDDAFLLGCGCPFGPAVGIVDAMRVSADVSPQWAASQSWPGFGETAPAAVSAIQASVLRAPLHRRVFINDPDCLLLRPSALDAERRQILAAVIGGTGGFTIVSDDLADYGERERAQLEAARAFAAVGDQPLDLLDPFAAAPTVRSATHDLEVDWREPPSARLVERVRPT